MAKSKKSFYIYLIIIILLVSVIIFLSIRAYHHYSSFKTYNTYFHSSNIKIESWMSFKTISKNFNLTEAQIIQEAGVNLSSVNNHLNLDRFCKEYHKDCTDLTNRLNQLAGR